ncbi:C2H2-type zinc finger protein [Aspergillus ibericus CBS 121593]|uniref:C2H2-type domain-containing protein n=1 Tax=Aspergillus ibericus CBS 121593 TaxID=1448316 RepID=A0A395HA50_9EURO|nr:hypothetical protein BO80DRAFT_461631 [Aspergillus ibericus CBS 121593]RAL04550.1 hypothetical protein BO80DRAFT_461631 [Aspergillus ibericus CBS 121593]
MPRSRPSHVSETKRKSRTCPHCSRAFGRLDHLQRHMRLHTHEKPYGCDCGEAFTRRDLLRRHQRIAHDDRPVVPTPTVPGVQDQHLQLPSPMPLERFTNHASLDPNHNTAAGDLVPDALDLSYPLEDFTSFIDNMGLALDPDSLLNLSSVLPEREPLSNASHAGNDSTKTSRPEDEEDLDIAQRVHSPTLLPIPLNPLAQTVVYMPLLRITEKQNMKILHELAPFQYLLPMFTLPSRESLTRFLNAWFDGVYVHMPFMHGPSFNPDQQPVELILAMAAAGAQYRYEHRKGRQLFYAAKTVFQERQRWKEAATLNERQFNALTTVTSDLDATRPSMTDDIRCLLNMMIYATWQRDPLFVRDACDWQSLLVRLLRGSGLVETDIPDSNTLGWRPWLQLELDRRVKLFSFALLNLQSIAYNLPPILLSSEVNLRLPCTCDEWRTTDESHWERVRQGISYEQPFFQDALGYFLKTDNAPVAINPTPSPAASVILIHGLLHRILLNRQASLSSPIPQVDRFEAALHRWTSTWQRAPESSLDPLNPNGPIPFTSTALLGLAYTRLHLDLGPCRALATRDARKIAEALANSAPLVRSPKLLSALLHATHALSIPVKLGVEFVSRSQGFVWSIQHALCGMEFAVLVSKWLCVLGQLQEEAQPLEEHETRLLHWIRRIVEEGRASLDDDGSASNNNLDCYKLAYFVVTLWARIMRGNTQWPFVDIIGQSLELYASDLSRISRDRDSVRQLH